MVSDWSFQKLFFISNVDTLSKSSEFDHTISFHETFENWKVDRRKCQLTMCSSSFAEKKDICSYLMHKEVDKLRIILEQGEKKIEVILSSKKLTLN